jgi:hypothetical protein
VFDQFGVVIRNVRHADGAIMLRLKRLCLFSIIVGVSSVLSSSAAAATDHRVAVFVDGPDGRALSAELTASMPSNVTVIDSSELVAALSKRHLRSLAADIIHAKRRKSLLDKLTDIASEVGADAVVLGGQDEDNDEVELIVLTTDKPGASMDERVPTDDEAARDARFKTVLRAALGGDETEPNASAPPPDREPLAEDHSEPTESRGFANDLISGFVGLDFGGRQLHYRDRVTNANLRPYDLPKGPLLPVAPGVAASVEIFPLASSAWSAARDIGLSARGGYNIASSKVGDVTPKTHWFSWEFNLRGRILLGPRKTANVIGIEAGLGRQAFTFSAPGAAQDILPSVDYYYWRLGADDRVPLGAASLIVGAAYRHLESRRGPSGDTVLAAGLFGEHFPHASIAGLDCKLGVAVPLASAIEARILLSYVRYWSTLHPEPGDPYVAGGALDQLINADLGIAAFF